MATVPMQASHAQSSYTEKLNVYLAGSDALWYFTFGGINGSGHLSALESTPGLNWYNVTAINTAGWQSDFQVFGPRGYNLLPVPYVTPSGMFLTVGADTYGDASAAAAALDSYLLTDFVSMSNGTGTYAFYSPVSFSALVPLTLLKFLPTADGGFAAAISASSFVSTPSPFVVLEGVKSSSGFDHSLVVGSIDYSAISSTGTPALLTYFGATVSTLAAANNSASSTIQVNALDGTLVSTDAATVTNNNAAFTGSYALSLAPGKHISGINATVTEQPAPLLAYRSIDVGVLRNGGDLAVTLTFSDLSSSEPIANLTYSDTWWNGTGAFKFLSGVDGLTTGTLSAGTTSTPVYRLEYTGSAVGPFTIPASVVSYSYVSNGKTFNATATLNPITLSLGVDEAVVYAVVTPEGSLNQPYGATESLNITVVNVGTLPASSVVVAGKTISGLAAKTASTPGGSATVSVNQSASSVTDVNVTRSYSVTYQDPSGTNLQATTNVISDVFSHRAMQTGFPQLTLTDSISPLSASVTNLTITIDASNLGLANVTSFKAAGTLPAGLGCGVTRGKGISCSGGQVTVSYASLNKSTAAHPSISFNVTTPANYLILPFTFQGVTSGEAVTGMSNLLAAPVGVQLTKAFTPAQLFGGMSSTVTANAINRGPMTIYNVTVSTTADSFDSLASAATLSNKAGSVAPGGNVTFSYPVSTAQTYGNLSAAAVSGVFYFGGTQFSQAGARASVEVYQPLSVNITTTPATPEEGKTFTITIQIDNPSGVAVNNVNFTLPVPLGLTLSGVQNAQVSSRTLRVELSQLNAGANATASATAVAGSGITVPFSNAKLTFSYSGVTVSGVVPTSTGIAIAENVTTRYVIPTALVLIVMLGVALYLRRLASSVPSSQK